MIERGEVRGDPPVRAGGGMWGHRSDRERKLRLGGYTAHFYLEDTLDKDTTGVL